MAPRLSNSRQVYDALKEIVVHTDREYFLVVGLDTKNRPLAINVVSIGTLDSAIVTAREVFKPAAIITGARAIVVAHSHPSGDPEPSDNDKKLTAQLVEAGKILGIPVLDHVIIGDESHFSFRDAGLL